MRFVVTAALLATAILFFVVGPLSPQPQAQALCPRFGGALERSGGVAAALQKIARAIPKAYSDARLSAIYLDSVTVCTAEFYSASHGQRLIARMEANLSWTTAEPLTSQWVLPGDFVDLKTAIKAAMQQGMHLPLNSAKLMTVRPRGKPAVAVWTLSPRDDPQGRFWSYFISAADAGHPLKLSDVTDDIQDYNAQSRYLTDLFHASQQPGSSPPSPGQPTITTSPRMAAGTPCVRCANYGPGTQPDCRSGIWTFGYLLGRPPQQWFCNVVQ